jgi:hypothetical protein
MRTRVLQQHRCRIGLFAVDDSQTFVCGHAVHPALCASPSGDRRAVRPTGVGPRACITHRGTAALLLENGRQFEAVADLSKDGAGTWSGTLVFPAAAKSLGLLNVTEGALRIGDEEGRFVRPDTSDWIGSPVDKVRIRIEGNGDAPF